MAQEGEGKAGDQQGGGDGVTPTVEQLVAQLKDRDDRLKAQDETISGLKAGQDRLEQLVAAATKKGQELSPTQKRELAKDFAASYNIPNEAVMDIIQNAVSWAKDDLRQEWQQAEALKELRDNFYRQNPELREHAKVVQAINNDIASKHPEWTVQRVLEETSKESKAYITKLRGSNDSGSGDPPNVIPAPKTGQQGGSGNDRQAPDLTPEQELQDDIKQRRESHAKALR